MSINEKKDAQKENEDPPKQEPTVPTFKPITVGDTAGNDSASKSNTKN